MLNLPLTFPISEVLAQPWRNGGGITRVLAKDEAWQVSVAEVTGDGPFSKFEGVFRQAVIIRGGGFRLTADGQTIDITPHAPCSFDGGLAWLCKLDDRPATVLNVMTQGDAAIADIIQAEQIELQTRQTTLVLPVNGSARYAFDGEARAIEPGCVLLLPSGHFQGEIDVPVSSGPHYLLAIRIRTHGESS